MLLFAAAIQVRLNVILYYFPGGYKPNRRLTHGGLLYIAETRVIQLESPL
jgi:hypothetical protein